MTQSELSVSPSPGDNSPHTINVSFAGGAYTVTDPAGVSAGAGCAPVNGTTASCAEISGGFPVIYGVALEGGGGDDKLTVSSAGPAAGSPDSPFGNSVSGIFGDAGNDTLTGSPKTDGIYGGDGNDLMDGGLGADAMDGKRGNDTVTYANRPASQPVFVDMRVPLSSDSAPPAGANGGAEGDFIEAENVIGTPGPDTIIGFGDDALIHSSSAANTFTGLGGNDRLLGGIGADHLLGGAGNDRLLGQAQKDTLAGGGGRDVCNGGSSKDHAKGCEQKRAIP